MFHLNHTRLVTCIFFSVVARTEMKISLLLKSLFLPFLFKFLLAFLCIIIRANIWQEVYEGTALFSVYIWQALQIFSLQYCQSVLNCVFLVLRCQHQKAKIYQLLNGTGAYVQEKNGYSVWNDSATITSMNSTGNHHKQALCNWDVACRFLTEVQWSP